MSVKRACLDESLDLRAQELGSTLHTQPDSWPTSLSQGTLTSADWPVVAPGRKHVAHFHTGDPLGPLQVVALAAGELDAGS